MKKIYYEETAESEKIYCLEFGKLLILEKTSKSVKGIEILDNTLTFIKEIVKNLPLSEKYNEKTFYAEWNRAPRNFLRY